MSSSNSRSSSGRAEPARSCSTLRTALRTGACTRASCRHVVPLARPLNIPRSPQGRPVIIKPAHPVAGSDSRALGRGDLPDPALARHDRVLRRRQASLEAAGRERAPPNPLAVMPFVGSSGHEAHAQRRRHNALIHPLVGLSRSQPHEPRSPVPARSADPATVPRPQRTLRARVAAHARAAAQLADAGTLYGRGVLVPQIAGTAAESPTSSKRSCAPAAPRLPSHPRSCAFARRRSSSVVPELQRRGLFRHDYTGPHHRDHLDTGAVAS